MIINTLDFETYTDEHDKIIPFCCCLNINNIEKVIYTDFLNDEKDYVFKKLFYFLSFYIKKEDVIYVHNINFDGYLIIEYLSRNKNKFEYFIRDNNLYNITIWLFNKIIKIKCSYKLIPLPLSFFDSKCAAFPYKFITLKNLNYKGLMIDKKYFNNINDYEIYMSVYKNPILFDFKKEMIKYCLNDLYCTKNILINFFSFFEKNLWNIDNYNTISSISYNIFLKYFNQQKKIKPYLELSIYEYIKKTYFGGRCEIFGNKINNKKYEIRYYDFKGMYAQCMLEKFPILTPYFEPNPLNFDISGFYSIKFESNLKYPILPIKHNNKLLFVNGILKGIYWCEEIRLFISHGGKILKIYNAYLYKKEELIFTNYINLFTDLRNKNEYYNIIGKLIINSLYGSFALKNDDIITIPTISEIEFELLNEVCNVISMEKINNLHIISIKKDSNYFNFYNLKKYDNLNKMRNIAYASIITSKARIKLYNLYDKVNQEGGRLLYSDTDSVFAEYKIKTISEIKWNKYYKNILFILPKLYIINLYNQTIIKSKGFKINKLSIKNIKKQKKILIENQFSIRKKHKIILYQEKKNKIMNINIYNKRKWSYKKISTTPIRL